MDLVDQMDTMDILPTKSIPFIRSTTSRQLREDASQHVRLDGLQQVLVTTRF